MVVVGWCADSGGGGVVSEWQWWSGARMAVVMCDIVREWREWRV